MPNPLLEDVFKRSGLPTYTFVEPAEYRHLKIALRTPGRGVVIEGPSGIGKTTAVRRAAADVGSHGSPCCCNRRRTSSATR
jgi:MoxR-like ATPase